MTRRGYFWLLVLVIPAPAFALSAAMSNALGQLFNAQLVAGLVLVAVLAIWVPHFIKRAVASQVVIERNVAKLDTANYSALEEADLRAAAVAEMQAPQKPYLDDVSDADFHTAMRAAGWSGMLSGPDPAGYDFAYELGNRISGLQAGAPDAPGQALGWGPEEFDAEDERQAELNSALHISAMSAAAWDEIDDMSLVSFLPIPVFEEEPDPLDQPE